MLKTTYDKERNNKNKMAKTHDCRNFVFMTKFSAHCDICLI